MTKHLQEIEDASARAGVNTFQTQMEVFVLSLLDEDRDVALGQVEEARVISLDHAKAFGRDLATVRHDPKPTRVATAMLERTFERLRIVLEAPDDDDPTGPTEH